jgi:hypothetical protein
LLKASQAEEVARADDLIGGVSLMMGRLEAFIDRAEDANDSGEFKDLLGEWRKLHELLSKLARQLQQEGTVNINNYHNEWVDARTKVVLALEPYPDALEAVVLALESNGNDSS